MWDFSDLSRDTVRKTISKTLLTLPRLTFKQNSLSAGQVVFTQNP